MIWNNELAEESNSAPAYKPRLPDATLTSVEISETAYPAPDPGEHQLSSGIVKAKRARTHTAVGSACPFLRPSWAPSSLHS